MARSRRWPSEKIEAMRKELLQDEMTFKQIADREGVSRQLIHQLVGNLGRKNTWKAKLQMHDNQEKVRELVEADQSDEQIATETGFALSTVKTHRINAGMHRPNPRKKWTPELIIQFAQEWHRRFGYLASTDWNPALAVRYGQPERAHRFYELGAPLTNTVIHYFGSWSEMIRQSGLPPAPRGYRARGRWKIDQPSD